MVDTRTNTSPRRLRVALAHDWLVGVRGGEHVLERIAAVVQREFEPAGLYTMFSDGRPVGPATGLMDLRVASLGRQAWSTRLRRWLLPMYPKAVAELSEILASEHARRPVDVLVSTSSAAIKGMRAPGGVPHVCYCHSPARYVWSQGAQYRGGLRGVGLRVWGEKFRAWDRASSANVTTFIANSSHTAREVRRSYERDAVVVHPPVREMFFETPLAGSDGPWLVVSALEPYKRVDLAIEAANRAGKELVVVGDGTQRRRLEALAGPTVRFMGRVSDAGLRAQYSGASLLLFPQIEDFGIVAVEAQACGVPIVARGLGGAVDILGGSERCGVLYDEDTPEGLLRAIEQCPRDPQACRDNARRFSEARFDARMAELIRGAVGA